MAGGGGPLPGNAVMVDKLEMMIERAENPSPVVMATLQSFHEIEAARWAAQPWTELASSTIVSREALGFGDGPILERTGDLEASLTGGGFGPLTITPLGWQQLSGVYYAGFHQLGMGKNPVRLLVKLTEATAEIWGGMYLEYVVHAIVSYGPEGAGVLEV